MKQSLEYLHKTNLTEGKRPKKNLVKELEMQRSTHFPSQESHTNTVIESMM